YVCKLEELDWGHIREIYGEMEEAGRNLVSQAGIRPEEVQMARTAEMRYSGQGYEISVLVPSGPLGPDRLGALMENFYSTYDRHFGRHMAGVAVEALTWRVVASGPAPRVDLHFVPSSSARYPGGYKGKRKVYIPESRAYVDCPVYERHNLEARTQIEGPAIVEERESTVVVGPDATATIDEYLNLIMDIR
ncbi:MAG: hydantoinase/oxoprolinase family protein, partial [Deltaproteobacteria bacterium]|nr:hydantoinase/oxoprolinase family protein [Deltaproteobacteria bacterium]